MGQVIGFVEWPDFINELKFDPPPDAIVRVQPHTCNVPNSRIGQNWVEYVVTVAAVTGSGNIAVARFSLGGAWEFDLKDGNGKAEELEGRGAEAQRILVEVLQEAGFLVRPGIIAGSEEARVVTTPTGLWKFHDGKLIPETEGSLEAA